MELVELMEGSTKLLVPKEVMLSDQPPKHPVFFNRHAKISRDIAILAYRAYSNNKVRLADALAGIGARGLRALNEVSNIEHVYINDINHYAIELARSIARLNSLDKCTFSIEEANRFLVNLSRDRVDIVEIDPFGTPVYYVDNSLRALKDRGMICLTATDTPVLQGLYPRIARRRYYGVSLRTEYSNEIGLRLMLGMLAMVGARLDLGIEPLFAHSIRNHLRIYAKVIHGSKFADKTLDNLGIIYHCFRCGNRGFEVNCKYCSKSMNVAGPLWISKLVDNEFAKRMLNNYSNDLDKYCKKLLNIAVDELEVPWYYSLSELCKRLKINPPRLEYIIDKLRINGYKASRTIFMMNGFKSDADYNTIVQLLKYKK